MRGKALWTQLACVLMVAVTVGGTYLYHGRPTVGIDDANIFFVYAEHLAAGHGFVYNVGGERVEGFTSMLWVLMCAAVFRCGLSTRSIFVVSVTLLVLTQLLLLKAIRRLSTNPSRASWPYELAYLVFVFSSPSYVTWMSITLMDTVLWGFLLAGGAYLMLSPADARRGLVTTALLCAAMAFARPEAMLVTPVFIALLAMRAYSMRRENATRTVALCIVAFVGALSALTVFRCWYFGFPFPNTYYAKVSPSIGYNLREGKDYLHQFLVSSWIASAGMVALGGALAWRVAVRLELLAKTRSIRAAILQEPVPYETTGALALLLMLVPVITGGDHFSMFRFFQPAYPLLGLTLVLMLMQSGVLDRIGPTLKQISPLRATLGILGVGVVGVYWLGTYAHMVGWSCMRRGGPIVNEFWIAEDAIAAGARIGRLFTGIQPLPTLGVIVAGGVKRTYPGEVVDLMGLNNVAMAHNGGERRGPKNHAAFQPEVFYALSPDVVLARPPTPPETSNNYAVWLKGLLDDPRFGEGWAYGDLVFREHPDVHAEAFFKRDLLARLSRNGEYAFVEDASWSSKWGRGGQR